MKKLILLVISMVGFAFSQIATTEYYYLDIGSNLTSLLSQRNPAYLSLETQPFAYAFSYQLNNAGGNYRLPFTPESKTYQNISVTAFQNMQNEITFAVRFAYRYEQRKNKLWLHNAENNLNIPFYFADSSIGDFTLNGIDWNIIFSYPLTQHIRIAVDVFYNVDEQFKSVFPKSNIKRNDLHLRPALAISKGKSHLGIVGSYFQFKEEMNTRKYSLEQGRSPIFMRIRGLDKPLLTYAETSEERLQTIRGYGVSGNINLADRLLFESNYESSHANIVDGGSYPVPQGSWNMTHFSYRIDLQHLLTSYLDANIFFLQNFQHAEGFHPVLENRIYGYLSRHFEGGITLPYHSAAGETWSGTVSYSFQDLKHEDNFLGLLHYFPGNTLHLNMHYVYQRNNFRYALQLGYDNVTRGQSVIYDNVTGWYYTQITEREIVYYSQERQQLTTTMEIVFPLNNFQLQISGTYSGIFPKHTETYYHLLNTSISFIF